MWSDRRADTARAQLVALAASELDVDDVQASAIGIVRRVVPFDAACWATVDPDTLLFTGALTIEFQPGPALEQRFIEIESAGADPNGFRELAARSRSTARLSDAGPAAVEASSRFQDIWQPLGLRYEVRAAFTVADRCWAVGGMLRGADGIDFSDEEVEFLSSVSAPIGAATRAALLRGERAGALDADGPAVLVFGPDLHRRSATPAAEEFLVRSRQLGSAAGQFALRSLVAAVGHTGTSARARLHDDRLGWLTLHASPLHSRGQAADVVVTVGQAVARDVTAVLLDAHGLSPREQEVTKAVCAGMSTGEIAAALYISGHTVQDHLKSVFDKVGVRSRRELTAYVHGTPSPAR